MRQGGACLCSCGEPDTVPDLMRVRNMLPGRAVCVFMLMSDWIHPWEKLMGAGIWWRRESKW